MVSHSFSMEDWQPDEVSTMDGRRAYFWRVPANVMGNWTLELAGKMHPMTLEQTFQKIAGSVDFDGVQGGLRDARLHGAAIAFTYVGQDGVRRELSGQVNAGRREGTFRDDKGGQGKWTARKR